MKLKHRAKSFENNRGKTVQVRQFEMLAKTLYGLEDILADEVVKCGGHLLKKENRAIRFKGDNSVLYRLNYRARTALRILKPLAQFRVRDEKELYYGVNETNWHDVMDTGKTFSVDPVVHSRYFNHSHYVALKVKDAIVDQFRDRLGRRPSVDQKNPHIKINVHIAHDRCTLSLDSTGMSLHKRGYRTGHGKASLNEVLAAGMILLSGWDGNTDFIDPMCGSGTLVIEAAMVAYDIAPGVFRTNYLFQNWPDYNASLFEMVKAERKITRHIIPEIIGSDISATQVQVARKNVLSAGLSDKIKLKIMPLQDLEPASSSGTIIINPPYGERVKYQNLDKLYHEVGNHLKRNFSGYDAWILSGNIEALKHLGLHPSKRNTLYNGDLRCKYQKYELYEGSKKNGSDRNKRRKYT